VLKRFTHIALAILLLVSTGGVTIYHHYCGKKLVSTTIDATPNDCCKGICNHCRTEIVNLKVTSKFLSPQITVDFIPKSISIVGYSFIPVDLYPSANVFLPVANPDIGVNNCRIKPFLAENPEAFLQVFLL
jgi:hypothetical protein